MSARLSIFVRSALPLNRATSKHVCSAQRSYRREVQADLSTPAAFALPAASHRMAQHRCAPNSPRSRWQIGAQSMRPAGAIGF